MRIKLLDYLSLQEPALFPSRSIHWKSPARLCEDPTRFSRSQHYGNSPRLVHARFGLLIITYGHPGLGRSVKGRIWMSAGLRKMKSWFLKKKKKKEWARAIKWIWDEGAAPFSGDMNQSQTNDRAQMDNRNRRERECRYGPKIIFHSVPAVTLEAGFERMAWKKTPHIIYKHSISEFSYNITEKMDWCCRAPPFLCAIVYKRINTSQPPDTERWPYQSEYQCLALI